jgi:hypothetical protein
MIRLRCGQDDFKPVLRELLLTHHGLEFLHDTPEFQDRYGKGYYGSQLAILLVSKSLHEFCLNI